MLELKASAAVQGLSVCGSVSHHVQQQVHRLSVPGRHLVCLLADLQQARRGQLREVRQNHSEQK